MKRAAGLLAALPLLSGCAVGVGAIAGPNLDTTGRVGTEARGEVSAAMGLHAFRGVASLAAGAGYDATRDRGYAVLSPGLGLEGGYDVRYGADALYAARLDDQSVRHTGGGAVRAHFAVLRAEDQRSVLFVGPRFSAEHLWGRDGERNRGVFTLSLDLRWLAYDSTKATLFGPRFRPGRAALR